MVWTNGRYCMYIRYILRDLWSCKIDLKTECTFSSSLNISRYSLFGSLKVHTIEILREIDRKIMYTIENRNSD